MVQPEGTVTNSYDSNGFMASVTDWRGDTIAMTNDADGRMLSTARSNGVDTAYDYDVAGRLTSVGHSNGATAIDSFTYDLDGNGNRTGVTSNAGAETYTLDALNRLTAVSYPGAVSEAFVYDDAGNRTSHTKTDGTTVGYTVDDTGQLVSDTTGITYTYDPAGNLTATSAGDSYTYDDYSRTTSVAAGATTQTYGYDAAGVRVTVDGIGQLWDRSGLPTLISTSAGDNYVHTAGVARDGDDWLLADAVGSVRATVDNAGATIGTADYSVFGEQLSGAGTFGFAGEQQDPTGLIHLRARQYNPNLGRFTGVDPVQPGAPGTTGYNLYAYSGNNPTTWGDPSGLSPLGGTAVLESEVAGRSTPQGTLIGRSVQSSLVRAAALLASIGISITPCVTTGALCGGGRETSAPTGPQAPPTSSIPPDTTVTTTTVLETAPSTIARPSTVVTTTSQAPEGRLPVWFGQARIGAESERLGRIDSPVRDFEERFRLAVFSSPSHPGVLIAINNRNLAALSLAGHTTAFACLALPSAQELDRLDEIPVSPATSLPTPTVAVTASRTNLTPVPPYQVTSTVSLRKEGLLPC